MGTVVDSAYIERLHEDISIACERLEEKGHESMVITVSFDGHLILGSQTGRVFLADKYAVVTDFIQYCRENGEVIKVEKEKAQNKRKKVKSVQKKTAGSPIDSSGPPEITAANMFDDDTVEYDKTAIFDASLIANIISEIKNPLDMYNNENNVHNTIENEESVSIKRENLNCSDNNISKVGIMNIFSSQHGQDMTSVKGKRSRQTVLRPIKSPPDKTKPRKKQTDRSCDICGKLLVNTRMLNKHKIMQHQQEEGPHNCDICSAKFKTQQALKIHLKRHTKPKYKCEICGKESLWLSDQTKHMRTHTLEKPFICDTCGKAFSSKQLLDNHITLHTGEKRFKCTFEGCSRVFRRWDSLKKHHCYHSTEYPYVCDFCGKKFKEKTCMVHHRKFHLTEFRWSCDYCEDKFKTCAAFKSHIARLHTDKRDEVSQRTNIKFYPCERCPKVYGEKKEFDQHMNVHLGLKPFLCGFCGKAFSSRSNMVQHKKTHTGERKLRCNHCSKTYSDSKMFRTHLENKHSQTVDDSTESV